MIVKMSKVFVVCRKDDRESMLNALRDLGVVHVAPADPEKAVADEKLRLALQETERAVAMLSAVAPTGEAPEVTPESAVTEIVRIQRDSIEAQHRLTALRRDLEKLAIWGDLRLAALEQLSASGLNMRFYIVPQADADKVQADCVAVVGTVPGRKTIVVAAMRDGEPTLPESAAELELPQRDAPTLREQAGVLDATLKADAARLGELAHLLPAIRRRQHELEAAVEYSAASRGGLTGDDLYAIQGWAPQERAETLSADLSAAGVHAGVQTTPPADNEDPPTLISYPWWARPIQGMFNILGTTPGYREADVSWAFMITMPLLCAMIISDGGYGLVYLLIPLIFYRKLSIKAGKPATHLLITIGLATLAWGIITTTFFGVDLATLADKGGFWGAVGQAAKPFRVVTSSLAEADRNILMRISLMIAVIHLSWAHVWQGIRKFPHQSFLSDIGWAIFLWGMYGVVKFFLLKDSISWDGPYIYLLIVGAAIAILFASPKKNPLARVGLGLANFPLSAIGTFGDTVSYMRLMAVGLAGGALASAFNDLGIKTGFWPATALIMLLGHTLNIALAVVSLFSHAVRLDMLEFSCNLGMQWSGYPYKPLAKPRS